VDPGAIDEKHLRRPLSMQSILLSADSSLPSSSSSSSSSSSAPTEDRVPAHLLDTPRWRAAPLPDDPNLENGTIGVPILPLPTLLRKSARRVDAEGKQIGREPLPNGLLTTEAAVAKLKLKEDEKRLAIEQKALRKRVRQEAKEAKEKQTEKKVRVHRSRSLTAVAARCTQKLAVAQRLLIRAQAAWDKAEEKDDPKKAKRDMNIGQTVNEWHEKKRQLMLRYIAARSRVGEANIEADAAHEAVALSPTGESGRCAHRQLNNDEEEKGESKYNGSSSSGGSSSQSSSAIRQRAASDSDTDTSDDTNSDLDLNDDSSSSDDDDDD
jgi:hypothetical protein